MRTEYRELLLFQCLHEYFNAGVWDALRVMPSAQTVDRLKRARCLARSVPAGVMVLAEVEGDDKALATAFTDQLPFTFLISAPGAQLASFTDIGYSSTASPDSTVLYFNNLDDSGELDFRGGTYRRVNRPNSALALSLLPVRGSRFVHRLITPASGVALELSDPMGNRVWLSQSPAILLSEVVVDLSRVPEGRYRLTVNGDNPFDFYLLGSSPIGLAAIVELFPGGPGMKGISQSNQVVSSDGRAIRFTRFALELEPRKVFLRYFILSARPGEGAGFDQFEIVGGSPGLKQNGSSAILFSSPERQSVDGQNAWVFESKSAVTLYQDPGDHYAFTLGRRGEGDSGKISLPFAQVEKSRLERTQDGQTRLISEMFVYV